MLKVDLVKDLKQQRDIEMGVIETPAVKEVKQLLIGYGDMDKNISQWLGKKHSLAIISDMNDKTIELEELVSKFGDNIFTVSQIKNLCVKYNMRFLNTQHFKGHLDVECLSKIKEFCKATNIEINESNLSYNYSILAPEELFDLKIVEAEKPTPIVRQRMPSIWDEPILFYKIDDIHYKLLHKWGKDFTIARRFQGLMWQSFGMRFMMFVLMALLVTIPVVTTLIKAFNLNSWYYLAITIIPLVFARIKTNRLFEIKETEIPKFFSDRKWNTTDKLF